MADSADLAPILFCIVMNTIIYVPMFSIIFTPAMGIVFALVMGIVASANYSSYYAGIGFWKGVLYSVISIFLWVYLIHRIWGKTISRDAVKAAYALSYAQWGIWYVIYFIIDMIDPRQREIAEIPFTSIEVRLYILAAVVSSLTLIVSFIRLYRARWDPKLAATEPEDRAWFDILPASVYVMPFLWSNIWLSWMFIFFLDQWSRPYQSPEPTTSWIVSLFFVVVAVSIIWMLWSPMKLVAQRAKRMIGKQAES